MYEAHIIRASPSYNVCLRASSLSVCVGMWLLEEQESEGCGIPEEFLDVRYDTHHQSTL